MAIKKIKINGTDHELQTTVSNITDLTATATELNRMTGVTSNVQTQLNGKAASSHTHNYAGSSSAGGAATSANKLNTNAGDSNTPVYFSSGVPVACTSLDLNTTGSSASCTGNAATATKLQTARTIGLSTGVNGTATSFNGTSNITIPVTEIKEAYLSWGGRNISGSFGPLDAALISELSPNRLAGMPDSQFTFERSSDGGSTWSTYSGVSGCDLVTKSANASNDNTTSSQSANRWHRITIDVNGYLYCQLRKIAIHLSTNGAKGCQCKVEIGDYSSTTVWNTVTTSSVSGWSGWNIINVNNTVGSSTFENIRYIRFTFSQTSVNSNYDSNLMVYKIRAYSNNCWVTQNVLAETGNPYSYDSSLNTTFPAKVMASSFVGSLTGNASTATTATTAKTARVSESDKGIAATSDTGAEYTATVSGITALSVGVTFIMIPKTVSTTRTPTLNVNGLGARTIRRRLSAKTGTTVAGSTINWLTSDKPVRVTYDGTCWVTDSDRPSADDIYGIIPITSGGTGATTAAAARSKLGAMADVAVTSSDAGKFLRVNSSGVWAAETVPSAESTSF